MEFPIITVEVLLERAIKKGKCSRDLFGYRELSKKINSEIPIGYKEIGERYLYDTIYLGIQNAKKYEEDTMSANRSSLDSIAFYVEHEDFDAFRLSVNPNLNPGQLAIQGNWYSLSRSNSGHPILLISPVEISVKNNNIVTMTMYGQDRTYTGLVNWVAGSLSCYLSSEDNVKYYHLAFKVGVVKKPSLLKGVFSGVSTGGLPIAGKELLLKSDESLDDMTNHIFDLSTKSGNQPFKMDQRILVYFENFENCYLKNTESSSFSLKDLDNDISKKNVQT